MPLRRNWDFQVLWITQTISSTGRSISTIAYPLLILGLTGSAVRAGLVGTAVAIARYSGGIVLAPIADHTDRKLVLICCDSLRFACAGAVAAVVWSGTVPFGFVLVLASVAGFVTSPISSVIQAAIVRVVPDEQLEHAMAQDIARSDAAGLAGNGIAGLLYGVARALPFAAEAAGYLTSIAGTLSIRTSLKVDHPEGAGTSYMQSIAAGLKWLIKRPTMLAVWANLGIINLAIAAATMLVIVFARRGGATSFETGAAVAMGSAAGIVGAVLAPRLLRLFTPKGNTLLTLWMCVITIPLLAVAPGFVGLGIVFAAMGFLIPATNVVLTSGVAREVPDHLRGRIWSFIGLLVSGLGALGPVLGGTLADGMGRAAALPITIPALVTALSFTFFPTLRNYAGSRDAPTASAEEHPRD